MTDLDPWFTDLRERVDAVEVTLPDLDVLLRRTPAPAPVVVPFRRRRTWTAAAAALLLVAGATVVLAGGEDAAVDVHEPPVVDPLDGIVILGPPDLTDAGWAQVTPPDAAPYDGSVRTWIGGTVGEQAAVVTLAVAPTGSERPSFIDLNVQALDFVEWFRIGLDRTPVDTAAGPVDIDGADIARSAEYDHVVEGVGHPQRVVVARGGGIDVAAIVTGLAPEEFDRFPSRLHLERGTATLDTDGLGIEPIGGDAGRRRFPLYEVQHHTGTVRGTPLDEAAAVIGADVIEATSSDDPDDPVLVRGGPDWLLSFAHGDDGVSGVRDGQWVTIDGASPDTVDRTDPIARMASLRPIERVRFDRLADIDPTPPPDAATMRQWIDAAGGWIPSTLPDEPAIGLSVAGRSADTTRIAGLPTLWQSTTGATMSFHTAAPLGSGFVLRDDRVDGRSVTVYQTPGDELVAHVGSADGPSGDGVAISAHGITVDELVTIAAGLRPGAPTTFDRPDGWSVVPLTDEPIAPGAAQGYQLDTDAGILWVMPATLATAYSDLAVWLRHNADGGPHQVADGAWTADAGDGRAAAFLLGDGTLPSRWMDDSTLTPEEALDVLRSIHQGDAAELDAFVERVT